jgi:hypothetical protein
MLAIHELTIRLRKIRDRTAKRHNTENLKQIFPEKELRDKSAYSAARKFVDRSWEYINRSQTQECGNWD